ncbi:MAG: cytochrome c-type biogenesis protein [Pseudomonadota bacterium]
MRPQRRLPVVILVAAALLGAGAGALAIDLDAMPTSELQERYDALIHELRCMQCQNQSIADSPVGLAADLRRDVREQMIAGKNDNEIRDSMVARYGNVILFRPPFQRSTAWVWLAPFVLLLVGVFAGIRVVRQRSALVASDDSVIDADETPR